MSGRRRHTLRDIGWQSWAAIVTVVTVGGGALFGAAMYLRGCEDDHITTVVKPLQTRLDQDSTHRFWREPAVTRKLNEHDSFFKLEYPAATIEPIQTKKEPR